MCLAVVALDAHPRFALVVAANRDEFHARPASAAHWWPEGLLAGRDERALGTWFGVNRRGRFAFVTNVREPGRRDAAAPTRGELVPRILCDPAGLAGACDAVTLDGARYNGFNIVAGDAGDAVHLSNRRDGVVTLREGVHGISNAALDDPWPKVLRTRVALAHWCTQGDDDLDPLWSALADRQLATDATLPSTGIPRDRERLLSAAFIVDPDYGTRASTLMTIARNGDVMFAERSFDAHGKACGEVVQRFTVAH
jgi:uncharacterized protein with NRDE domain